MYEKKNCELQKQIQFISLEDGPETVTNYVQ